MRLFKSINAVAIDGPAGSGKSTISRLVAERLGYVYIDTGAMYRALTLKAMKKDIDFADEGAVIALSMDMDIELLPSDSRSTTIKVLLDGQDVSDDIRTLEVTGNVKHVAGIPLVRKNLVGLQRKMAEGYRGSVMEGRDIGTVVLPDARYKIYLDASFDERVERRFSELQVKGTPATRTDVALDLKQRDHADKTRKVGPLKKAADAVLLDTTYLTIDQVVGKIVDIVKK